MSVFCVTFSLGIAMDKYFVKTLKKFTESQGDLALAFRDGVQSGFAEVLNTGDDEHWTKLDIRIDGNGNRAWYVDLYRCDQAKAKETMLAGK
jgi:hypothetical protein